MIELTASQEFMDLLQEHKEELYAQCFRYCKHSQDAEDLHQELMIRLLTYSDKFALGTNFRAWSYTVLHHVFVNFYRKAKTKKRVIQEGFGEPEMLERFHAFERDETHSDFSVVLSLLEERMNKDFYDVLYHVMVEDLSYVETATLLDIPKGTVMSRLYRARRYARLILLEEFGEEYVVQLVGACEALEETLLEKAAAEEEVC